MFDVLVVDDDEAVRELHAAQLTAEGYSVHTARDGLEAIHALSSDSLPKVIVLDLGMPRMSGRDFLRIKQMYLRWAVIPVVVITGTNRPVPAAMTGVAAIITKGEPIDALLAIIRALLDGSMPPSPSDG